MRLNKPQKVSWMPMIVVAAAAFVSALMSPAMISIVAETYSGTQRTRALAIVSTLMFIYSLI